MQHFTTPNHKIVNRNSLDRDTMHAQLQFLAGGKPAHAPHSAPVGFVPNLLL
jgi:hypothetical protein